MKIPSWIFIYLFVDFFILFFVWKENQYLLSISYGSGFLHTLSHLNIYNNPFIRWEVAI